MYRGPLCHGTWDDAHSSAAGDRPRICPTPGGGRLERWTLEGLLAAGEPSVDGPVGRRGRPGETAPRSIRAPGLRWTARPGEDERVWCDATVVLHCKGENRGGQGCWGSAVIVACLASTAGFPTYLKR